MYVCMLLIRTFSDLSLQLLKKLHSTVTQQVSHRPIKRRSRLSLWSRRGAKVNGTHHGDNPLLKPEGIRIATKPIPGPTNREHSKLIGVKAIYLGYELQFLFSIWSAAHPHSICLMGCPIDKVIKSNTKCSVNSSSLVISIGGLHRVCIYVCRV